MGDRDILSSKQCKQESGEAYNAFSQEIESSLKTPLPNCKQVISDGSKLEVKTQFDPYENSKLGFKDTDFSSKDCDKTLIWKKEGSEKKLVFEKQTKDLDFAPISSLYPMAESVFKRVDTNCDGNMTSGEIKGALLGDSLNDKEKSMLKILSKDRNLIDNDRNGISMSDVKEFDAKINQYEKELAMSRKYAPDLAAFTRELHHSGKGIDENCDGKFSRKELISFYIESKKDFAQNPTEQGKRDLAALNWGISNFDQIAVRSSLFGSSQIDQVALQAQMLRQRDLAVPPENRQGSLSQSDRYRVEQYQRSFDAR